MIPDEELWRLYNENAQNATRIADLVGMSGSAVRDRIRRIKKNLAIVQPESVADHLSDLLEKSQTPTALIETARLKKLVVGTHPFAYKNAEGEGVTEGLFTKRATFEFTPDKEKIDWPPIAPATPVEVTAYTPLPPPVETTTQRVFIWGDSQIHFWREKGGLVPFHDEAAIDVGLQALARYRPHKVVIIGDFLDLPGLGRYRKEPAFAFLMNAAIAYATHLLAKIRAIVGPECEIVFIPGNHEARLEIAILENLMELYGIKRPGDTFSLLSMPFLLSFEKYNVQCAEQFPSGQVWLSDTLVCMHKPDRSVAATQICGHEVKGTVKSDSLHFRTHRQTNKVYIVPGFGDYTRTPADPMRVQRTNIPSQFGRSNAEQAFATVDIYPDVNRHSVQVWEIENGGASFREHGFLQGTAEGWVYDEAA